MVCIYKFFTCDMIWRTKTCDRAPLCCTAIIFTLDYGQCFVPPVMVRQITHYTKYLQYNIPSYWAIHNSPSRYMDHDGWHKFMSNFPSVCFSSTLYPQVLIYGGHDRYFYYRALGILLKQNIHYFILKVGDSVHDQPNDNGPNMKLNNLYGDAKWTGWDTTEPSNLHCTTWIMSSLKYGKLSNYHPRQSPRAI